MRRAGSGWVAMGIMLLGCSPSTANVSTAAPSPTPSPADETQSEPEPAPFTCTIIRFKSGDLREEDVLAVLNENLDRYQSCFNALGDDARAVVSAQILIESGKMVGGSLGSATINNYTVRECLVRASMDLEFDPTPDDEYISQSVVEYACSVGGAEVPAWFTEEQE